MLSRLVGLLTWLIAPMAVSVIFGSCSETRYLLQAGPGQLELATRSRPISEVIADSGTDARTRALLIEVERIRDYANSNELATRGNYQQYVDLNRSAVVYFLAASKPLAFEPKLWNFPFVGSFPYTGWFDFWAAQWTRKRLEQQGWDVTIRPVRAYSTGGWLHDPVLSTMLTGGDGAIRYLANVVLHELTHANFFIANQATFNESLASFVGDQMADDYLIERFGATSTEVSSYRAEQHAHDNQNKQMAAAYAALSSLYQSSATTAEKQAAKKTLLRKLRIDADLAFQPNNASLVGFKTYNSGRREFKTLYTRCGSDWKRFFRRIKALSPSSFPSEQMEAIDSFVAKLAASECP